MTTASVWLYPEVAETPPDVVADLQRLHLWEYGYAADPEILELMGHRATHKRTGELKRWCKGLRVPSYDDLYWAWRDGIEDGYTGSPGNPYGHPAEAVCWYHGYRTALTDRKARLKGDQP